MEPVNPSFRRARYGADAEDRAECRDQSPLPGGSGKAWGPWGLAPDSPQKNKMHGSLTQATVLAFFQQEAAGGSHT